MTRVVFYEEISIVCRVVSEAGGVERGQEIIVDVVIAAKAHYNQGLS